MNLYLSAPIGFTGYGYASLNILTHLMKNNHNVGLSLIGNPNLDSQDQVEYVKKAIDQCHKIDYESTCLKIWHQFDLINRPGNGKYYAFPFFEVDKFNDKEIYHLNFPDELIVSCQWAKNILIDNKITKPINVVPMGVDTKTFDFNISNQTNNYVFITIGKWEKRKAHDVIIECFNSAFTENDNVELWMVTHNPFLNKEEEQFWLSLVEKSKLRQKIRIFPRLPSHESVAELLSYSNCGIYISRGEGWNLELLETMAMNKPVIASNYSAHTEYCNNENSFLVEMNDLEPAIDNKFFFGTSNWGKIDQKQRDQTIEYMKHCYANNITENKPGLATAQKLSWQNTSNLLEGCIKN